MEVPSYGVIRWPVHSLGCHFHHLILETGMISKDNFERIFLLCVNWAVLADENSCKMSYLILYHFLFL